MKMICTLSVFVLFCVAGAARAGNDDLPLDKRIALERVRLTEEYQNAASRCREKKIKFAKRSCIGQNRELLNKTLEELEQNPKAYFLAKEQEFSGTEKHELP